MRKIRISNFTVKIPALSPSECVAPFSLSGAFAACELDGVLACELSARFVLGGEELECGCVYLSASGIGAGADIALNGKPVVASADPSRTYLYNAKPLVREGENEITVTFKSTNAPLFANAVGIFGAVSVLAFNNCAVDTVSVLKTFADGEVTLDISASVIGSVQSPRAVATLISPSGKMYYSGMSNGHGKIKISDPVPWKSCDCGTPTLYKLTVTLYSGEEADDIYETYIGLSDFSCEKSDGVLSLSHNGEKFFAVGAYSGDIDTSLSLISPGRADEATRMISEAGVNLIYIEGGEFCPSDAFYRMCDKYGILIVRALPPLGAYSSDTLAVKLIGVGDALTRVAIHPSLAMLVCDTADLAAYSAVLKKAASDLLILPKEFFDGIEGVDFIKAPASLPPLESVRHIFGGEMPNVFSPKLSGLSDSKEVVALLGEISKSYLCPTSYEGTAYASAVASAHAACDRIFDAKYSTNRYTGAVLAEIYDRRPEASGSAIDWMHRKKALYYLMNRLSREVALSSSCDGGCISIRAISKEDYSGKLRVYLKDSENRVIVDDTAEVDLKAGVPLEIYRRNFSDFINEMEERAYVSYALADGHRVEFSGSCRFRSAKEFKFLNPNIRTSISGGGKKFEIDLVSTAYAEDVELSFDLFEVELSDNFFSITENSPIRVYATVRGEPVSSEQLSRALRIRSVYGIGKSI